MERINQIQSLLLSGNRTWQKLVSISGHRVGWWGAGKGGWATWKQVLQSWAAVRDTAPWPGHHSGLCTVYIYVIHSSSLDCLDGPFESGAVYTVVEPSCIPDNLFSGFKGQPSIDAKFSTNISEMIEACLHKDLNSGPNPDWCVYMTGCDAVAWTGIAIRVMNELNWLDSYWCECF